MAGLDAQLKAFLGLPAGGDLEQYFDEQVLISLKFYLETQEVGYEGDEEGSEPEEEAVSGEQEYDFNTEAFCERLVIGDVSAVHNPHPRFAESLVCLQEVLQLISSEILMRHRLPLALLMPLVFYAINVITQAQGALNPLVILRSASQQFYDKYHAPEAGARFHYPNPRMLDTMRESAVISLVVFAESDGLAPDTSDAESDESEQEGVVSQPDTVSTPAVREHCSPSP